MELSGILTAVTLGAVILSAIVNFVGLLGKHETMVAAETRKDVKLDNIFSKVECIEKGQEKVNSILQDHGERIVRVEERLCIKRETN